MTAAEAAELLGLAGGTVREYCRAVGLEKINGQYDIDPDTVEEWRHNPPAVAALRKMVAASRDDFLDGPPLKRYVLERVPNLQAARKTRQERLLAAIRKAGV